MTADDSAINADGSDATRVASARWTPTATSAGTRRSDHAEHVRARRPRRGQSVRVRRLRRARRGLDPLGRRADRNRDADRRASRARPVASPRRGPSTPASPCCEQNPGLYRTAAGSSRICLMHSALTVHELGLTEFISGLDQIIAVYAAAMQAPAERLGSRRSIMVGHTGNPNFRAFGAFDAASGELAGFCYGFRGQSGQWWHDTVEFELAAARGLDLATQWLEHSYEVAELHVRPATRVAARARACCCGSPTARRSGPRCCPRGTRSPRPGCSTGESASSTCSPDSCSPATSRPTPSWAPSCPCARADRGRAAGRSPG